MVDDNSKNTVSTTVSFEKKLFEKMEKKRGLISRSAFLNDLLRNHLPSAGSGP